MQREPHSSPSTDPNPSSHKKLVAARTVCPACRSARVQKKGLRRTVQRGPQQRWRCPGCHHAFTVDEGFWKMKTAPARVVQALDTYYEGLSLRKVSRNLRKYTDTSRSHQSVLNWLHKYATLIRRYVATLHPTLGGHYLTDETLLKCAGQWHNFGLVLDKPTRYVIATRYTEHVAITPDDNIQLWRAARDIQRPTRFTSDAHGTYLPALKKVFGSRYKVAWVQWDQINAAKTGRYNYLMERVWNTLKERLKIMRGFKAPWSAKLLLDGYFQWYNFVRPHMTLRTTPGVRTGQSPTDWLRLIEAATQTH